MNQVNPNQVPDHRMSEMAEQLRKMREENSQLRNTINQVYQRQMAPPPPQRKESPFDPKVDQALTERVKDMFSEQFEPQIKKYEQSIGYLHDKNDALEFQLKWGKEAVEKYGPKIEEIRKVAEQQGRWLPREEAYKHIFFEETARKPQPKPQAQQAPAFDPYLQKWSAQEPTQEATQPPVDPTQVVQPPPQAPQYQQQPPQFPQQQVQQQQMQQQMPSLPPMVNHAPVQTNPISGAPSLDLTSDEAALAVWEKKFGDQEL